MKRFDRKSLALGIIIGVSFAVLAGFEAQPETLPSGTYQLTSSPDGAVYLLNTSTGKILGFRKTEPYEK